MNAFAHCWYYIPYQIICQCIQSQKTFFVQGVDKWAFLVYNALRKGKGVFEQQARRRLFIFSEKERLLWVLFLTISAVWCLMTV